MEKTLLFQPKLERGKPLVKTRLMLAYLLPMLQNMLLTQSEMKHRNTPYCIILVPSKELIYQQAQILKSISVYFPFDIITNPTEMLYKRETEKRTILITSPLMLLTNNLLLLITKITEGMDFFGRSNVYEN